MQTFHTALKWMTWLLERYEIFRKNALQQYFYPKNIIKNKYLRIILYPDPMVKNQLHRPSSRVQRGINGDTMQGVAKGRITRDWHATFARE